ncbi:MAG: hydrogenase maturation protease [Rubrivivax sp.]|nr:hydrogenase maturation protease [Rubrivivax sp.]
MTVAPWLVLAVGNPSRGDDALGPLLLDRLRGEGWGDAADVELLTDFQLQVEHALDLRGRRGVLFVDAARPGTAAQAALTRIAADDRLPPASHALRPQAVLHVAARIDGAAPPAWVLAIEGRSFALGSDLSAPARRHLAQALPLALAWLRRRRAPVGTSTVFG